jgi:HK97 family phage prohead protease
MSDVAIEFRQCSELRVAGRTLHGMAVPFGRAADLGAFSEQFLPGSLTASVARDDVRAYVDHQPDRLLGRTKSGTLRLRETAAGLEFEVDAPATSHGNDLVELARRNDLSGVSVGFVSDRETWPAPNRRNIHQATLREISILTGADPAYPNTSVAVRSRNQAASREVAMRLRILALI